MRIIHFTVETLFLLDIPGFFNKTSSQPIAVWTVTAGQRWGCVLAVLQGFESFEFYIQNKAARRQSKTHSTHCSPPPEPTCCNTVTLSHCAQSSNLPWAELWAPYAAMTSSTWLGAGWCCTRHPGTSLDPPSKAQLKNRASAHGWG